LKQENKINVWNSSKNSCLS